MNEKILQILGIQKDANILKLILQCSDKNVIESCFMEFTIDDWSKAVLIPKLINSLRSYWGNTTKRREDSYTHTAACISSQIGCPMNCIFCANARTPFVRNLTTEEMIEQIKIIVTLGKGDKTSFSLKEIQFGGIGEPLYNYGNVVQTIKILFDDEELREKLHICKDEILIILSTVGIVPQIYKLAKEKLPIFLQVSLHASNDTIRKRIIPASTYTLNQIFSAIQYYADNVLQPVIINYVVISGINSSTCYAEELAEYIYMYDIPVIVKVSYLNPTGNNLYSFTSDISKFVKTLKEKGILAIPFKSLGTNIRSGCGQLRSYYGYLASKLERRVPITKTDEYKE